MKKFLALILSALILTSLAACGEDTSTDANTTSDGKSSSASTGDSTSDSGSSTSGSTDSAAASGESTASEESGSSETASSTEETSDDNKLINAAMAENAGELLEEGLHNFFVELDEDKYRLKIDMYTTTSDESKIVIITRDGDSISAASGYTEDDLSKSIIKDNKGYVIDDDEKTVTWSEFEEGYAESYTEYLAQLFYITDIEQNGSGKEKFGDTEMDYEEYKIVYDESSSSESSETEEQYVRYYFENKEFKGMKIMNGDDYYSLRIVSMTHEIPDGEFDYPSDYELIEAEEYSYEIDGDASSTESSTTSE